MAIPGLDARNQLVWWANVIRISVWPDDIRLSLPINEAFCAYYTSFFYQLENQFFGADYLVKNRQ